MSGSRPSCAGIEVSPPSTSATISIGITLPCSPKIRPPGSASTPQWPPERRCPLRNATRAISFLLSVVDVATRRVLEGGELWLTLDLQRGWYRTDRGQHQRG